ncbi:hypothetical protein Cgig2_003536 [Carnegiea gigantea]|uniref:Uncharacterized protein n=1 Tax=Carnegiea gigantea TaxID=171969 RepID=A0A9Q1JU71_9CARY|nr:hypothetical protein Cgig2_003536 [Carnegiea gigantea]
MFKEKLGCLMVSLSRSGKSVGIFSNFVVDDFVFWSLDDDLFSLTPLPTPEGGGAFEMGLEMHVNTNFFAIVVLGIFINFVADDFVIWSLDDDLFSLTPLPTPEGGGAFEMRNYESMRNPHSSTSGHANPLFSWDSSHFLVETRLQWQTLMLNAYKPKEKLGCLMVSLSKSGKSVSFCLFWRENESLSFSLGLEQFRSGLEMHVNTNFFAIVVLDIFSNFVVDDIRENESLSFSLGLEQFRRKIGSSGTGLGLSAILVDDDLFSLTPSPTPEGGGAFEIVMDSNTGIFSNFVVDDFVFWSLNDDLFSLTPLPTPEGGGTFEIVRDSNGLEMHVNTNFFAIVVLGTFSNFVVGDFGFWSLDDDLFSLRPLPPPEGGGAVEMIRDSNTDYAIFRTLGIDAVLCCSMMIDYASTTPNGGGAFAMALSVILWLMILCFWSLDDDLFSLTPLPTPEGGGAFEMVRDSNTGLCKQFSRAY